MRLPVLALVLCTFGASLRAQSTAGTPSPGPASAGSPSAQLPATEVNELCVRLSQLMDAGGVAMPAMSRSADPLVANVRQACAQLQSEPGAGQPTYTLLSNVRAYIALTDAIPKPFPFPDTARDQLREVRDGVVRLDAHFRAVLDGKDASLRTPDRDQVSQFQEENRLVPPPAPGGRRVVFLGDSVTAQWRLKEYFPEEDFINRSIDGQLSGQLLGRMKPDVVNLQPAAVVIQGGTYDLARGIAPVPIEDNYSALADIASANRINVIFTSVLPVSDYHQDANPAYQRTPARPPVLIRALNDWIKALCAQRGYTYVDYYSALVDQNGMFQAELSDDGLLPNAKGYRLMAPLLAEAIVEATKPAATPAKPARKR